MEMSKHFKIVSRPILLSIRQSPVKKETKSVVSHNILSYTNFQHW